MDNMLEINHKHGREMRRLALQHSLEMAKLYRDYSEYPIERLIAHLEAKLQEESVLHSRWDEIHRERCEDCRADYLDEQLAMADDARLDAMGGGEL